MPVSAATAAWPRPNPTPARRRAAAGRARAAVLTGLLAFVALQAAAGLALELWLPQVIDADYGGRLACIRRGRAADPARAMTVVMVGSSRTYNGLDADALNAWLPTAVGRPVSVVNCASEGGSTLSDLLVWTRLRRNGVRPDLMLVEATPAFLSDGYPPAAELRAQRMPASRLGWLDLGLLQRYEDGARPDLGREVLLAGVTPLYSRRAGVLRTLAPKLAPPPGIGGAGPAYRPGPGAIPADPPPEQRAKARAFARQEHTPALSAIHAGGRSCGALCELIASCREANVPVALVLMPEGPAYRSWYPPGKWEELRAWLDAVSRDEHVPVVNAREWMGEDAFYDSHHLLPGAARRFSDRLGRDYLVPWLRGLADGPRRIAPPLPS